MSPSRAPGTTQPTGTAYAERHRLGSGPTAPLKIASGCDRRCSFCAIPAFRGAFVSRPPRGDRRRGALAGRPRRPRDLPGQRELHLLRQGPGRSPLARATAGRAPAVDGIEWIRVSYLQPAEMRPSLIEAMTGTEKVVPYFDLSFQHAAPTVLRRMRRFGNPDAFLALIDQVRTAAPNAGIRATSSAGSPGRPRPSSVRSPTSWPPPSWMRSACSATPTRTARRPPGCPDSTGSRRSRPGGPARRPGRGAGQPASREPDRRAPRCPGGKRRGRGDRPRCPPGTRGRRRGAAARAPPGPGGRSTRRRNRIGTDGVDLVAEVIIDS